MSRRLRKLAEDMQRWGIFQDWRIQFGKPRVAYGAPIFALFDRFKGGDAIAALAEDYGLEAHEVENAIRFCANYPKADLESFWRKADGYREFMK